MKMRTAGYLAAVTAVMWMGAAVRAEPYVGKVSGITSQDPFVAPKIPLPTFPDRKVEVKEFGATGDGKTNDTQAINRAIEKLASQGGGVLHFSRGKYMAASIHLKSNIHFVLDNDAVIEGLKEGYDPQEDNAHDKYQDYGHSHYHDSVMWGENIENFAITGGQVNGGGTTQSDSKVAGSGNKVVAIKVGKNLAFKDVTHLTGAHFVYLLNDCENINFSGITIKKSRDAIDIMGCRNVAVTGCHFTGCSDDTLGIKSDYALGKRTASENIYAWDCYFESGCNGLQFGSETAGDFKNVRCWNIKIALAMKAGIGITCNDSATIEDVVYRDIEITNAANPIFVMITDRLRTGEQGVKPGKIRNILFQNISISQAKEGRQGNVHPMTIVGMRNKKGEVYPIEDLTFENVKIVQPGGGKREDAALVPPEPPLPKDGYSPANLGVRPAGALFMRHVRNLTFKNFEITYQQPDARPAVVIWDAQGLVFDRVKVPQQNGVPTLVTNQVSGTKATDSPGLDGK